MNNALRTTKGEHWSESSWGSLWTVCTQVYADWVLAGCPQAWAVCLGLFYAGIYLTYLYVVTAVSVVRFVLFCRETSCEWSRYFGHRECVFCQIRRRTVIDAVTSRSVWVSGGGS